MALGVGGSFLAVYSVTGSRLRAQIDSQLKTQVSEWQQFTAHSQLSTPAAVERTATRFIAAQRYHAESLLIVVQAAGGRTVSNNPGLLAREETRERSAPEATGLLDSRTGLATASVAEAGGMRVLATPIRSGIRTVGTLRVANPLTPVQQAQSSLRRSFLVVGALALLVAIGVAVGLASLIAAPLRRMARVAAAVDAGDLSVRTGAVGGRGEAGVLAAAFDHMLDRLERAFKRQRDFVSDASLQADPDRLTQVLRNLVRNAVAHTERGDRVAVLARAHDSQLEASTPNPSPGKALPSGSTYPATVPRRLHRRTSAQHLPDSLRSHPLSGTTRTDAALRVSLCHIVAHRSRFSEPSEALARHA